MTDGRHRQRRPAGRGHRGLGGTTYAVATAAARPLVDLVLARRLRRGREDPARIHERRGRASLPRPAGPLLWIHAASIGEALSVQRLIERLLARYPALNVLVTTGTVTSAQLLAERLPARACHQFVPVDRPAWVRRFLDHWRPDAGIWVESEIWPNLVFATQRRGIPMVLVNARMSAGSFRRWRRMPAMIHGLLKGFALVMAQNEAEADRLIALGARPVTTPGNLKYAAASLPVDGCALEEARTMLGDRPRWLAASTHEGEEAIAGYVHKRLVDDHPGLVTIIAPRHPGRAPEIAEKLRRQGLIVARRGAGEPVAADTDIYVADTLGELGLFYRLAPVAFVGGSLIPHGGQNILEPGRLGCAVLHGPHMDNFRSIADEMVSAGASREIADAEELVKAVGQLLVEPALREDAGNIARALATAKDDILDSVMEQLAPVLAGIAARARTTDPWPGPAPGAAPAAALIGSAGHGREGA